MRDYTRSGPVCLGALVLIAGAIIALMPSIDPTYALFGENTLLYGAIIAVVGLILIIIGFAFTKKKRDSVLAPVGTKLDDTPPPPPPPD
jgi:dipeptide/tripeptide permease